MRRGLTRRMLLASGLLAIVVGASFLILLLAITNLRDATQERRETRQALIAADELQRHVIHPFPERIGRVLLVSPRPARESSQ